MTFIRIYDSREYLCVNLKSDVVLGQLRQHLSRSWLHGRYRSRVSAASGTA